MYNVYLPRLRRGRDCAREYELGTSAQKCNRNHSENIKISNLQIVEHLKMLYYVMTRVSEPEPIVSCLFCRSRT